MDFKTHTFRTAQIGGTTFLHEADVHEFMTALAKGLGEQITRLEQREREARDAVIAAREAVVQAREALHERTEEDSDFWERALTLYQEKGFWGRMAARATLDRKRMEEVARSLCKALRTVTRNQTGGILVNFNGVWVSPEQAARYAERQLQPDAGGANKDAAQA